MILRLKPVPLALVCLFSPAALSEPIGLEKLRVDPALLVPPPPKREAPPRETPPAAKQPAVLPPEPSQVSPAPAPGTPVAAPAPVPPEPPASARAAPAVTAPPKQETPSAVEAPAAETPPAEVPGARAPVPEGSAGPAAPAMQVPAPAEQAPATPPVPGPTPSPAGEGVAPVPTETPARLQPSETLRPVIEVPGQPVPLFLEADQMQGQQEKYVEAEGSVQLRRQDQSVDADRMHYDLINNDLRAEGAVRLEQPGARVTGSRAELDLDTSTGRIEQPVYQLTEPFARGDATDFTLEGNKQYRATDASFTTCPAGNDDWLLRAGQLDIDRVREIGTARNVTLDFKGVPVLYSPYLDFPIGDQRKSGFLAPVLGATKTTGTDILVPYYWNIAPNMDATIAPRYMSKRGVMLDGEYRYLFKSFNGLMRGDYLGNDDETGTDRWGFLLQHYHNLGYGFNGVINYQRVSDDNFLRDFGNRIALTSQVTLPQEGYITYGGGWWSAIARYQKFQTLQDLTNLIVPPYNREPQFGVAANRANVLGFDLGFNGEYVDFKNPLETQVSGDRTLLYPSVSYPLVTAGTFLIPRVSLHYTNYTFSNPSSREDASLTVPIYSLDGGLIFERDWSFGGENFLQTLEPRAFYVYAPFREQDTLPVYDTAEADFNFAQLFLENRFIGGDRVNDANQITLAVTSRLLRADAGDERVRVSLGQRFYFDSPRVTLVRDAPTNQTRSDFLAAATVRVGQPWLVDTFWQYDPSDNRSEKFSFLTRYQPELGKVANVGYRYTVDQIDQVGGSVQWPLGRGWWSMAALDYDLDGNRALNAVGGLEYNSACWAVRLVLQRFATAADETTNQFFVQLELRGLARIGPDPLDVLRQTIPGYTAPPYPAQNQSGSSQ